MNEMESVREKILLRVVIYLRLSNGLPINIIMDGVLMKENVEIAGIDDKFIMKCISKANLSKVKDVLIMTLDNNGEVFVQGRDADECFNFQMKFNGGDRW